MNILILKRIVLTSFLSFLFLALHGVPAKRGMVLVKQPDGTSIRVQIVGDERFHYYVSEDGLLLNRTENDCFYYADFDAKTGLMKSTGVKASNPNMRSESERKFVSTRSKELPSELVAMPKLRYQRTLKETGSTTSHKLGNYPTLGKQKSLAILVQFKDKKFTIDNPKETFRDFMMKKNFTHKNGAHSSVRDYYLASSDSLFDPQFDVFGPVTLPENLAYYGANDASGNDVRPAEMVAAACQMLDSEIDFSQYDCNQDGWVDNVYLFYAGYSEAEGASANSIWPHSWDIWLGAQIRVKLDGVYVGRYGCSQELDVETDDLVGMGVFCHEFGHVLGLPDLYPTGYNPYCFSPGAYTLMDYGSYNDGSHTPPLLSAYERWVLGWHTPILIDRATNGNLPPLTSAEKKSYMINTTKKSEMYILENRQQEGFDRTLPGHGMLVWHIDYSADDWESNNVNNIPNHQGIDLVEADGLATDESRTGDPFPGTSNITAFTDNTYPSMRDWANNLLNLPITEIKESNGIITFKVLGGIFELNKVIPRAPTEVTATSFTLEWGTVVRANDYLVSVYKLENNKKNYVYQNLSVGDVTRYVVTGLSPLTTYYSTLTASDGSHLSEESAPVQVKTLEPDFSFYMPKILPATEISSGSFSANWETLDEATAYCLSVYKKKNSGEIIDLLDFSDGISEIPEGWSTDCNSLLFTEGYYGTAVPSMRMGNNGSYIVSPLYNGRIKNISFWYRGQYFGADNRVTVWVYNGKEWQIFDFLDPASGEEHYIIYGEGQELPIGNDVCQFRITFDKASQGFVYLDDIRVTVESKEEPELVAGFDKLNVGDLNSYKVEGLEPLTTYFYTVKAFSGDKESLNSPQEQVQTLSGSAINQNKNVDFHVISNDQLITVTAEKGSRLQVYSSSGTLVKDLTLENEQTYLSLEKGIYIIKNSNKVVKAVVK